MPLQTSCDLNDGVFHSRTFSLKRHQLSQMEAVSMVKKKNLTLLMTAVDVSASVYLKKKTSAIKLKETSKGATCTFKKQEYLCYQQLQNTKIAIITAEGRRSSQFLVTNHGGETPLSGSLSLKHTPDGPSPSVTGCPTERMIV